MTNAVCSRTSYEYSEAIAVAEEGILSPSPWNRKCAYMLFSRLTQEMGAYQEATAAVEKHLYAETDAEVIGAMLWIYARLSRYGDDTIVAEKAQNIKKAREHFEKHSSSYVRYVSFDLIDRA